MRIWLAALLALLIAAPATAQRRDDVIAIDVLLQPDAEAVAHAKAANARLRERHPEGYALDESHAPHITLVQRFIRRSDLPKVMGALDRLVHGAGDPRGMTLQARGYTASDFGGGLLLLDVERSPALDRFQQQAVDAVRPFAVSGGDASAFVQDPAGPIVQGTIDWVEHFVPNASGAKFAPHITIGVGPIDFLKGIAAEPFERFTFKPAAIAVYQLGNYGTARRLLWTSAKPPLIAR